MLSHAGNIAGEVACIWLFVWGFRRKYEVDYALDGLALTFRWVVVAIGFLAASFQGQNLGYVRLAGFLLGMSFLCWPNCAYHLARWVRHLVGREG
jgi:hypothetical protein